MIDNYNTNPWKGLNFYVEGDKLFGRSTEIDSLSQYIFNNSQTVLYGKSGIGKTSILNAGIFPIARKYGMTPIGIRLDHNNSVAYIEQIKSAIHDASVKEIERVPVINQQHESLWEYLHRNTFINNKNETTKILLVFDQFEEIFTLQKVESTRKDFFNQLADLLNGVTPAYIADSLIDDKKLGYIHKKSYLHEDRFHIVITLREDYLSYLERYTKYIPVMKSNRYALQPINEEQAKEIIMKPNEGLVDEDVAHLIIEKVTGFTDFSFDDNPDIEVDSAVLSLYLSELFETKAGDRITSQLVEQRGGEIISDFYEKAISCISESSVEYLENNLLSGNGNRENITIYDAKNEGGITEKELNILINEKKILRKFNYAKAERIEFIHDILCPVVKEHIEQRKLREQKKALEKKNRRRVKLILLGVLIVAFFSALFFKKKLAEKNYEIAEKNYEIEKTQKEKEKVYEAHQRMLLFMGGGSVYKFIEDKFGVNVENIAGHPNSMYAPVASSLLWGMIAEEYYNDRGRQHVYCPIFMAACKIDKDVVNSKIPSKDSINKKMLIVELCLGKDTTTIYFNDPNYYRILTGENADEVDPFGRRYIYAENVRKVIDSALKPGNRILYTTSKGSGTFLSFKHMLDPAYVESIFDKGQGREEFHETYPLSIKDKFVILGSVYYHPNFGKYNRIATGKDRMYYIKNKKTGDLYLKDMCLYFCVHKKDEKSGYEMRKDLWRFLTEKLKINIEETEVWNKLTKYTDNDTNRVSVPTLKELGINGYDYIIRFNAKLN